MKSKFPKRGEILTLEDEDKTIKKTGVVLELIDISINTDRVKGYNDNLNSTPLIYYYHFYSDSPQKQIIMHLNNKTRLTFWNDSEHLEQYIRSYKNMHKEILDGEEWCEE